MTGQFDIQGASGQTNSYLTIASSSGASILDVQPTCSTSDNCLSVLNSAGTTIFSVSYYGMTYGVSFIAGGTPTIATSTGAGTAGTASIAGGNNSGQITINALTSPATNSIIGTITPSIAATNYYYCTIWPSSANARSLAIGAWPLVTEPNNTTWTITSGSTALTTATTYQWNYTCFAN